MTFFGPWTVVGFVVTILVLLLLQRRKQAKTFSEMVAVSQTEGQVVSDE